MGKRDHVYGSVREAFDAIRATEESPFWTYDDIVTRYPFDAPENAVAFESVTEMKAAVTASGSHFYDRDSIRHFLGRTDAKLFGGRFWVESRKYENPYRGDSFPREYMVAWVSDHRGFLSVERLGSFNDLIKARWHARELAYAVELEVTPCEMVPDGVDTDGSEWNRCTVHDELVIGDAYLCEGFRRPPYVEGKKGRQ